MFWKKQTNANQERVKPKLPAGFRDCRPEDALIKNQIIQIIRKAFEDFGFDPIETPAAERTEVLTGGEKDSSKIIFNLRGSQEEKSDASLRFDLTVPLARFMAANPDIAKPFKRYQIGNVWRGESPQAGRWREFMQADIDIVGSSSMEADSEIIALMNETLKNLDMENFLIKINNRKILNGLPQYADFPKKKLTEVLKIIDKQDKIGLEAVKSDLRKTLPKEAVEKIERFLKISGEAEEKLNQAENLLPANPIVKEGIVELKEIAANLDALGIERKKWEINFSTVRGLGYYTGPVFETILTDAPELGSVFSGGRYDNLMIPFTGQKIPAVGASLGVDRFIAVLEKMGLLKKKQTVLKVLILNLSPELKPDYLSLASQLRKAGVNSAIYLGDDKSFQAQLAYAVKKGVPYVIIYGEDENRKNTVSIKNLATREQKEIPKSKILEYFRK